MSEDFLKQLRTGNTEDLRTNPDPRELPRKLDIEKFNNGRKFFQDNVFMCVIGMACSLIAGFSVANLLEPLVFTNKSNTPEKSLKRYLETIRHVALWHYGDIWDPLSSSRKSITKVYNLHTHARDSMMKEDRSIRRFTQYDMSLVQAGFIGFIIMYADKLGLQGSKSQLNDFVYFWRWIGNFLGIQDGNNICINGFGDAYVICKQVENEIVYPALFNPPKDFYSIAKAFTDGLALLTSINLITPESAISFSLDMAYKKRIHNVNFLDKCRIFCLKAMVFLVKHLPWFRRMVNRHTESLIVPKSFIF